MPRTAPLVTPPAAPAAPVTPPAFPPVEDDPFAPPPASGAQKKASSAPKTESAAPENDDPFAPLPPRPTPAGRPKVAAPTGLTPDESLARAPQLDGNGRLLVREWVDSSGQFRVQGRLVLILDGKVRLLKGTGRTTTVPMERLSAADRAYVAEVIARYGSDLEQLGQLAAR